MGARKSQIFTVKRHPYNAITSMSLHKNQNKLAVGHDNGYISIWDLRDLRPEKLLEEKNLGECGNNFVQWYPGRSNMLACGINNSLYALQGDKFTAKSLNLCKAKITGLVALPKF